DGQTFDCGSKEGFIIANVALALKRDDIRPKVENELKALISALK
ncbi:MAG: UTP--glucose-1-phosphate uridylyltransferase, partial [Martelella sp.]